MKQILKKNIKLLLGIIIGIILAGISVYAAASIDSSDVAYSNTTSGLESTTVKDALDELTTKVKANERKVCERATILHKEECSGYCSYDGYSKDDTMGTTIITYGNLGTNGTLTTGDAFDCDVNGDGIYNSQTERFYYISDMDNDTIVLVYYNNVSDGLPNNTSVSNYSADNIMTDGPLVAITELPTTTQWKNVYLKETIRNIEGNTVTVSNFSYEGYAARLLTYQEVEEGCYDGTTSITSSGGLDNKCKFLMENTKYSNSTTYYGYWLETPNSNSNSYALYWARTTTYSYEIYIRAVGSSVGNEVLGVRPVIEVSKSDIDY